MNDKIVNEAYDAFRLEGSKVSLTPFGNGLINRTYEIVQVLDNGEHKRYILQRINHHIFPNIAGLMNNIQLVTTYLKAQIIRRGGNPYRETLTIIPTQNGELYYQTRDGAYWRVYPFIEDTYCLDKVETSAQFEETGRSFGAFQAILSEFDASQLVEVIAKFHDTRDRYEQLEQAIQQNKVGRVAQVAPEIAFIQHRKQTCYKLYDMLDKGELPLRVTHNDTKLNNILLDKNTHKGICIVDLDTIMPGISLFDFGDAIRFGANDCAEDESDMTKVNFDLSLFETFTKGFLNGANGLLSPIEIEMLPWGALVITLEQGIRFLTDYLNGDTYFGTTRDNQNLDRTRTQLKLVADMESQWDSMQQIVAKYATQSQNSVMTF